MGRELIFQYEKEDLKHKLNGILKEYNIIPEEGLGTELFHFVSTLTPIINVDLLVYNDNGQFLLSRRNDPHSGIGWHIPGGCLRFKESLEDRIRLVALNELGINDIHFKEEPKKVFQIIEKGQRPLDNQRERAHFITLVYECYVDPSYKINNRNLAETDPGYMRWFDKLPEDLLSIQSCYKEILD